MAMTNLLPPFTAVRLAWALTGAFSNDPESKLSAVMAETTLKDIQDRAKSNDRENKYIVSAIATINSSQRSLDTVYKGRQLNFEENEKLREAYLDEVRESLDFGKKAKDFIQSLPAMTIGAVGGITLTRAIAEWVSQISNTQVDTELLTWGFGLFFAAVGYLVNLQYVRNARDRTQQLYVEQDYESVGRRFKSCLVHQYNSCSDCDLDSKQQRYISRHSLFVFPATAHAYWHYHEHDYCWNCVTVLTIPDFLLWQSRPVSNQSGLRPCSRLTS